VSLQKALLREEAILEEEYTYHPKLLQRKRIFGELILTTFIRIQAANGW
jgi:hypothetical protein